MNLTLLRNILAYLQREEGEFNFSGGNGLVYLLVVVVLVLAIFWFIGWNVSVGT